MGKLLGFAGTVVGSAIGWWIGAKIGLMTAVFVSAIGTGLGLYAGRRIAASYDI
jgi:hypothetical protein